jgi:hypothetical protein
MDFVMWNFALESLCQKQDALPPRMRISFSNDIMVKLPSVNEPSVKSVFFSFVLQPCYPRSASKLEGLQNRDLYRLYLVCKKINMLNFYKKTLFYVNINYSKVKKITMTIIIWYCIIMVIGYGFLWTLLVDCRLEPWSVQTKDY